VQVPKYFLPFATIASWMLCAAWREKTGSGSARGMAEAMAAAERTIANFMVEDDRTELVVEDNVLRAALSYLYTHFYHIRQETGRTSEDFEIIHSLGDLSKFITGFGECETVVTTVD
jgi:hypothetical protein